MIVKIKDVQIGDEIVVSMNSRVMFGWDKISQELWRCMGSEKGWNINGCLNE